MDKFGIIGNPVAGSMSPRLFAAAYGGRWPYELIEGADFDASWARFLREYKGINITVPFPGKGTETEPWLIQGAEKLSLLAKCVNVGAYDFAGKYVKLDNGESYSYDMSAYNNKPDNPEIDKFFEPIGLTGDIYNTPFCGIFDGNNVTISGINYSFDPGAIVVDLSFVNCIGLFGQIGISAGDPVDCKNGIVKNLRLSDCTFASEYDQACFVGGIAGYIDRGGIYGSTVSSSTVSASDANSHTGAIFGHKNAANVELENNHYTFDTKVSLGSGTSVTTASGYTKRGGFIGTAWDDITINDGAMLYVKKATIAGSTSTNGSAVTFNEVTKGTDRYDKDGDDFYYAVGQPVTLSVTLGSREEKTDIRTLSPDTFGGTVDFLAADLSFISLRKATKTFNDFHFIFLK